MDGNTCQPSQGAPGAVSQPGPSRSSPGLSHPRRFEESWIEVASQPSSSSLSSIGDEIVTAGLRVRGPYNRRRRLQASARSVPHPRTAIHAAGASSQEEYDESESEDDRLLTSSTENAPSAPSGNGGEFSEADSDSDGDNATALGRVPDRPVFHPQPNAFSHPPRNAPERSQSATSSMPPHPHSGFTRPSFSQRSQTRVHRDGPSFMSPSAREDNDAALRASLTTLLSCAAAARGLPKSKEEAEAWRASRSGVGVGPSQQPMELRLVPESELMQESAEPRPVTPGSPRIRRSPTRQADKSKRCGSTGRNPRASKKKKVVVVPEEATLVSPTLLTWMVSAGVVVLVSVVGFGAGYVIGREVGRQEAQEVLSASMGVANETSHTGREVIRSSGGFRQLRWGARAVGKSITAQA
ncbi:uncharacterized protein MAM_01803 [Metarhizium album ARSEF 1941]|uniref:Transmembrane protein n=1 Tax=Metarhizium album (strain ARSEF 1941) TaxID=1081103 RepID=A0A0B2X383_METAS|nr:uncharacterized protein MAM_01803 [Metarhizium album ARSEF 1941]KHN99879.1 hypothetical protein MAM_01803 [Metarhizium album ARSEF 1941]